MVSGRCPDNVRIAGLAVNAGDDGKREMMGDLLD